MVRLERAYTGLLSEEPEMLRHGGVLVAEYLKQKTEGPRVMGVYHGVVQVRQAVPEKGFDAFIALSIYKGLPETVYWMLRVEAPTLDDIHGYLTTYIEGLRVA